MPSINPPEGFISFEDANKNKPSVSWDKNNIYQPKEKKLIILKQIDIRDLEEYIDWNILFSRYNFAGRYPKLLKDPEFGEPAEELLDEAKTTLIKIKKEGFFQIDSLFKVWKSNSDGNTLCIEGKTMHFLRQQAEKKKNQPNYCLSDFVAPRDGGTDYLGGYLVSVTAKNKCPNDTMYAVLSALLIDAARKYLHLKIRTEYWAYAKREKLATQDILKHKYQGIIIPFNHAALPNTQGSKILSELLNAEVNIGRALSGNHPVNQHEFGLCFSHPESRYFGTGKLCNDQFQSFINQSAQAKEEIENELKHLLID
jgi:5-methyltetrahydrofolate--homocysteine methyltransferase